MPELIYRAINQRKQKQAAGVNEDRSGGSGGLRSGVGRGEGVEGGVREGGEDRVEEVREMEDFLIHLMERGLLTRIIKVLVEQTTQAVEVEDFLIIMATLMVFKIMEGAE